MLRGLIFFVLVLGVVAEAATSAKIITSEALVNIYSGPGRNFRLLRTLNQKGDFLASSKLAQGKDGEYYKVLIRLKNGVRHIGYIATDSPVKYERSAQEDGEDIDQISTLHLSKSAFQASFHMLKNSRMYWTAGYINYLMPSFYVRPYVGQLLTDIASSVILGTGIGTDHFFSESYSFFTEVGGGFVAAPRQDAIFKGSESANSMLQALAGVRYNAELAAVSFGVGQTAIFNANNSYLGWNVNFSLEVGL